MAERPASFLGVRLLLGVRPVGICRLLCPTGPQPLVDSRVLCSLPCFSGTSAQGLPRTDFQGGRTRGSCYCLGSWFSKA